MSSIRKFLQTLRALRDDERGASAIEYGLIAAGIAVAIAVTVTNVGTRLNTIFGNILTGIGGV